MGNPDLVFNIPSHDSWFFHKFVINCKLKTLFSLIVHKYF